jgi:hypothetical protein
MQSVYARPHPAKDVVKHKKKSAPLERCDKKSTIFVSVKKRSLKFCRKHFLGKTAKFARRKI